MQRANDPRALQWFLFAVFLPQRHKARHFSFGDIQFLAAKIGQRDILDDIILGHDPAPLNVFRGHLAPGMGPGNLLSRGSLPEP